MHGRYPRRRVSASRILVAPELEAYLAETIETEKGYGDMRVYDCSRTAAPTQVGSYRTSNSLGTDDQAAGDYVIHNNFLVGTDVDSPRYSRQAHTARRLVGRRQANRPLAPALRCAWKRRRRSALETTEMLEKTIARLAITGLSRPIAASGMAARL